MEINTMDLMKILAQRQGTLIQDPHDPEAIRNAVRLWAEVRTDPDSARRPDLLRDKQDALIGDGVNRRTGQVTNPIGFFTYTKKHPAFVTPIDITTWQAYLEGLGLSSSAVYARISRISSFYNWAMNDPMLSQRIRLNPVKLARPRAPKAYQNESAQALLDEEVKALVSVLKAKADAGDIVGKRDYALLLFYLTTGMRRREVIQLRWGDIRVNDSITLTGQVKGSEYVSRQIEDKHVQKALLDYLQASGRLASMSPDDPLWTRHDRAGKVKGPLTSHAFVKNLKQYAKLAGIRDIHLHQTRHTFARIVGEESGSILEAQDALGHKNLATTKVYLQRVSVKRDKFSRRITKRLGL
jgi:integrase/recombinase XerD